ncbi:MAG TPA: hypothetical protein VMY99_01355 [Nevskiaceae bacterium]|nr:hypothetical protein [Nevskiaceae bacterium]
MLFKANQVITIAEARLELGDEAMDMTDEEVQKLIEDFDVIAQYTIGLVQKFKKKETKQMNKMIK